MHQLQRTLDVLQLEAAVSEPEESVPAGRQRARHIDLSAEEAVAARPDHEPMIDDPPAVAAQHESGLAIERAEPQDRAAEISRFLGIVIKMYYREHGVPHFHAIYGEHKVSVEVESGLVHGKFPTRALRHVLEWSALHRAELLINWELAGQHRPLRKIAPLE